MENAFEHKDALIAKFLAGESSPEETSELEAWRKESPEHTAYFEENKRLLSALHFPVNTELAWKKLDQRISQPAGARVIPLFRRPALRVAAAILLLAGLGFIAKWFVNETAVKPLVFAASDKTEQQVLPDGSKVFLNKKSEISYTAEKNGERRVSLKGEAFFEVTHQAEKPFVISVNDILIKDIGTSFNVRAIPGSPVVEVLVESGEVQFYSEANAGLLLKEGEKAVYHIAGKQFIKSKLVPSDNTISYKTKNFEFNETPLIEVVQQLNTVYNSDIQIRDETIAYYHLSVSFKNENLDIALNIIAETLDLDIERNGTIILLKRKSDAH